MTGVRMDKWLWAARFFKTRSLAARACELGRIEANGHPAKPAREVRAGDMLKVKNEGGDFQVEVLGLERDARSGGGGADALPGDGGEPGVAAASWQLERKAMPQFEAPAARQAVETRPPGDRPVPGEEVTAG